MTDNMTAPAPRVGEMQNRTQVALFKVESIHHVHGTKCLCGFESHVSRDRTKHIMEATLEAADVAYLLAELRKAHEALARVEALAAQYDHEADRFAVKAERFIQGEVRSRYLGYVADTRMKASLIRAAVAAANGDAK